MKNYPQLIAVALLGVLFFACASRRQAEVIEVSSPGFSIQVKRFEFQDVHPGVESNLLKLRSFRLLIEGEFEDETSFVGMRTDSVTMLLGGMSLNGELKRMPFEPVKGNFQRIELRFNRQYMADYSIVDPDELGLTPHEFSVGAEYYLTLKIGDEVHSIELDLPEALPAQYAP